MSFWEKMQEDVRKNIHDGIAALREGGTTVSKKIELLTEEGKKKYKIYSLQMSVKEEFERLGGQIYDLKMKKSKNPMSSRKVTPIINRISKLETRIARLEKHDTKKSIKKAPARSRGRKKKS
jgi:Asp-tRNA(Asn)/Glu-tRNA(Gln) amidotransferase A subunit family amidase